LHVKTVLLKQGEVKLAMFCIANGDVWGSRGIVPRIVNLAARWKAVPCKFWLTYSEAATERHCIAVWIDPRTCFQLMAREQSVVLIVTAESSFKDSCVRIVFDGECA
jgi:hypothetical protein